MVCCLWQKNCELYVARSRAYEMIQGQEDSLNGHGKFRDLNFFCGKSKSGCLAAVEMRCHCIVVCESVVCCSHVVLMNNMRLGEVGEMPLLGLLYHLAACTICTRMVGKHVFIETLLSSACNSNNQHLRLQSWFLSLNLLELEITAPHRTALHHTPAHSQHLRGHGKRN